MAHELETETIPEDWSLFSDRPAIACCYDMNETEVNNQCTMDPFGKDIILSPKKEQIFLLDEVSQSSNEKSRHCQLVLTETSIFCIFETNKVERYQMHKYRVHVLFIDFYTAFIY